jgi:site-specific DNA-methyltransferase (adenine-specific)
VPRRRPGQEELFPSRLFYGDNLHILRNKKHIADDSVDLVYLDPPFKPTESYNVLFRTRDGKVPAAAQVRAFEDTWRWDDAAAEALRDTMENAPEHVGQALKALRALLGDSDMFAYMCMMAPRLVELRKVMKATGSIYLHCDTAASHYLKILMDAVFGPENFRNEVIWKRTGAHGSARRYAPVHDVILFYGGSERHLWNRGYHDYKEEYLRTKYKFEDERGRYRLITLVPPGIRHGDTGMPWRGIDPSAKGVHWTYQRSKLDRLDSEGMIYWGKEGKGLPQLKRYLKENEGIPLQDVWTDIAPLNSQARERLGYPTQKPAALLERIIRASSNPGDMVLDPFCGCGTAIEVAERLGRTWYGIDITEAAISIIRERLDREFGESVRSKYSIWGEPASLEDAQTLARDDPYQFQWWAVRRLGAREVERRKGADKGVDGRLILPTTIAGYDGFPEAIIQVKAGRSGPDHVRGLIGTLNNEDAPIGVLVTLKTPTAAMRGAAASAGFCSGTPRVPRIQLMTAQDILDKNQVQYPRETQAASATVRQKRTRVRSPGPR